MRTNQDTNIVPTDAERENIANGERRLRRAVERLDDSKRMLARAIDDADLRNERIAPERVRALEETVAEDGLLVAKIEAELDSARRAPAIKVERDKRAAELRDAGEAIDAEIAAAINVLESALDKGETVAHQIVTEFGDPALGYQVLTSTFRASTLPARLRLWKRHITKERIAEYRKLAAPQVSQPTPDADRAKVTGVYNRPVLSRAERQAREVAMRTTATIRPGVGVVATERAS
jgi:hypothetical protein